MDPVTIAYMGAQVAKGAADFFKNQKQKKAAKNLPKMQLFSCLYDLKFFPYFNKSLDGFV